MSTKPISSKKSKKRGPLQELNQNPQKRRDPSNAARAQALLEVGKLKASYKDYLQENMENAVRLWK